MKRFITICLIAALLGLVGCDFSSKKDQINSELADGSIEAIDLKPWVPYVGSIPTMAFEGMIDAEFDAGGNIILFDSQYNKLDLSNDLPSLLFPGHGWRINLDEMTPFRMEGRDLILMIPEGESHEVICTIDPSSNSVSVYFREDIAKEGISYFDYSQFDIYYDGTLVGGDARVKRLWDCHTQNVDNVGHMLMEESPDSYSLTFVYKQNPAIQYELQFNVWDDMLCMDNIVLNEEIYITIELFRDGIKGAMPWWKK